jgi:3-methyladenine DNA glycosylase AlkD
MIFDYSKQVLSVFKLHVDDARAASMAKYMKGKFAYFGINSPTRKEISKPLLSKQMIPQLQEVPDIAKELWQQPERELQYFTLDLLAKCYRLAPKNWIDLYEELITTKSWWDTVDGLAANQVGGHFQKYPDLRDKYTDAWMASKNIWLQRSCLIFQLRYKKQTDFDLMKSLISPLASSDEFFIRKAIGWALRQYVKFEPAKVIEFVESQPMSNLSKREALKLIM